MLSYIKEFVHGDFGRTKPNLGELLNSETDILQLDVEVGGEIFVYGRVEDCLGGFYRLLANVRS